MKQSYRSAADLLAGGFLSVKDSQRLSPVLAKYQFVLPRYYANLIDKEDPNCPIRLQAIPHGDELENETGFLADPLADLSFKPTSRVTHRFKGRVLLHLTPNCSMYCRFCFRKTLLNELKTDLFAGGIEEGVAYVAAHADIEEVIFSGGDPLMVSDGQLAGAIAALNQISHLQRLRFHTRVPVTFPARITPGLVEALKTAKKPVVIVTHYNHPKELTEESTLGLQCLYENGFTLLNQTVLLKNVNDSVSCLAELSRRLFERRVIPYYLHQLDSAQGTSHFEVSEEQGKAIYTSLQSQLSGYLVPRYVKDVVGAPFKSPLA